MFRAERTGRSTVRRRGALACAAASICLSSSAWGVTKTWIGGTGFWETPTNWAPAGRPLAADFALLSQGPFTVTYDNLTGSSSIGSMSILNGMRLLQEGPGVTFTMSSSSIGGAGGGSLQVNSGTFTSTFTNIGSFGPGQVLASGGTVGVGSFIIGNLTNGSGLVTISGGGDVLAAGGVLGQNGASGIISLSGAGSSWLSGPLIATLGSGGGSSTITVSGGATMTTGGVIVGAGGDGEARADVFGSGSRWINSGSFVVGSIGAGTLQLSSQGQGTFDSLTVGHLQGSGTLLVSGGATLNANSTTLGDFSDGTLRISSAGRLNSSATTMGAFTGSSGAAVINGIGSLWRAGPMTIGSSGTASLTVSGGAELESLAVTMGSGADGRASALITGTTSLWDSGTITVSATGAASLTIRDGAIVFAPAMSIATNPGSTGIVDIAGAGAVLNAATLNIGGSVADGGAATLTIGPATRVLASNLTRLRAPGALVLNGGTLQTGSLSNAGALYFNSGTLLINGPGLTLAGSGSPLGQTVLLGAGKTVWALGSATISSDGVVQVSGGRLEAGTLQVQSLGQLIVDGPTSIVAAGTINNSGLMRGDGAIGGLLNNGATGEVRVASDEQLTFPSNVAHTNSGLITMLGGALQFGGSVNNSGRITGRGLLSFAAALNNSATLSLSGGVSDVFGTVTNLSGGRTIVTGNATGVFQDNVTNNPGSEFRVSSGSTAVFLGTVTGLAQFTGSGTTIFEGPAGFGGLTRSGTTVVEPSGSLVAGHIRENALIVNGPATITAKATANDPAGTSVVNSLSIDPGGVLDLTNNSLIIDYDPPVGSLVSEVRQHLQSGRIASGSATPATGLGYGDNALLNKPTFAGQVVDSSSLLIKFTYFGDADLNGQVDVADLGALASNWQTSAPWTSGDFDYSGFVDVADLGLLASNWQAGVGSPLGPGGALSDFAAALAAMGFSGAVVPEPGSALIAAVVAVSRPSLRRRRRLRG
jgi:T5SS/PEP-CTERM-associated repeat protein